MARTKDNGYSGRHKRLRQRWDRDVKAGRVFCARCGKLILPNEPWDLGHVDGDKSRYAGPEHRACNRATMAHRKQRTVRSLWADDFPAKHIASRDW